MGDLECCSICDLPVLELEGQFELLQPYYAPPGDPVLALVGEVHTSCLATSPLRGAWVTVQIQHFSTVRSYEVIREAAGWTILLHRRLQELIAFSVDGASISISRSDVGATPYPGGVYLQAEGDYHISHSDRELIAHIQHELTDQKRIPLSEIADKLHISEKLQWPAKLDLGDYVFTRSLRRDWSSTSVAGRMRYKRLVPDVVYAAWRAL